MMPIISVLTVILYSLAAWHIARRQFTQTGPNKSVYISLSAAALVLHCGIIINHLAGPNGVNMSLLNAILVFSWVFTTILLAITGRFHVILLLPISFIWSAVMVLLSIIFVSPQHVLSIEGNVWLKTHMVLALLAYSLVIISTLFAGQMLFINNRLKSKNIESIRHLPPIVQVEKQLFIVLALGTMLLLCSLLTGFIFLDNMFANTVMHKTLLSLLSALIFVVILWGHATRGWRGKPVFSWILIATLLLSLAYFGSRFVREVILERVG